MTTRDPMSGYWPKAGEWAEVVVRGQVEWSARDGSGFQIGRHFFYADHDELASVEKVEPPKPPLPTTPGSVIRRTRDDGVTYYRLLRSDGRWIGESGMATAAEWLLGDYDTVHDAGATS